MTSPSMGSGYGRFDRRYARLSQLQSLLTRLGLTEDFMAIQKTVANRIGQITLPALILGGTSTQALTWTVPMPSADYQVYVAQEQVLGKATVLVTSQDANGVVVQTTATAVLAVGARLLVIAWNT